MESQKFISIEGNIGSGKSTILKIIRESFPQLVILDEPLASWEKVGQKQNVNLLQMYYSSPKRWGFTFQIYAFMSRLKKWTQYSRDDSHQIKVSERSLLSDRFVFASIMNDMDILNEAQYQIYLHCYRDMIKMNQISKIKGIIYVQCDPTTCLSRIQKRAREGEGSIPFDYLERLHEKHEEWLNPTNQPYSQQTQSSNNFSSQENPSLDNQEIKEQQYNLCSLFEEKEVEVVLEEVNDFLPLQSEYGQQQKNNNCEKKLQQQLTQSSLSTNLLQRSSLSVNNQKVLIIDNTQPIDKNRIVNQLNQWLSTVF